MCTKVWKNNLQIHLKSITFVSSSIYNMDITNTEFIDNPVDIELNKPSKSRFLFLLGLFGFIVFFVGCNYGLWTRSFKSTEKIEVPESTQYTPKYK